MVSCAKRSCFSRDSVDTKKLTGITFHKFPLDPARRKKWTQFANRGSWEPTRYSVLCSKHFSEISFDRFSKCYVRLNNDAVPTLDRNQEQMQAILNPPVKVPILNNLLSPPNICNEQDVSLSSTSTQIVSMAGDSQAVPSFFQEEDVTPREQKLNQLQNILCVNIRDRKRELISVKKKLFQLNKRIANMNILIELRKNKLI